MTPESSRMDIQDQNNYELFRFALELPHTGWFDWNLLTDDLTCLGTIPKAIGLRECSKRRFTEGLIPFEVEEKSDWLPALLERIPSIGGLAYFEHISKVQTHGSDQIWIKVKGNIAFTDDSLQRTAVCIRGLFEDVTDLYERVDRYNAVFESIGNGVVSFDSSWNYVFVNKNAEKLLGRSIDQLQGKLFWDVFPNVVGGPLEKVFRDAMQGQNTYYEYLYEPWNRWFGNFCSSTASGGVTIVFQDITDKKRADEARQKAEHKALVEQISVAAQTVAALAHELNQPLMVLEANSSSLTHLLRSTELEHEVRCIIQENEKQTRRAGNIFRDLVCKINNWRNSQKMESRYDVHALVETCVRGTMTRFPEARIHLELTAGKHYAFGDQIKIEMALLNVLANAAESVGPLAVKRPEVHVKTVSRNSSLILQISDNGTGLSEEVQALLFSEFSTTKENGLGLGLSIAKSLLEEQGGKVWFHGNLDPGAEFRIEIPVSDESENRLSH